MPFDNPLIEIPVQNAAEIAILDKVLEIIPTHRHWCRDKMHSRDGQRSCLIGALKLATNDNDWSYIVRGNRRSPRYRVWSRLRKLCDYASIESFNDDHSYKDVRNLIVRARVSFE